MKQTLFIFLILFITSCSNEDYMLPMNNNHCDDVENSSIVILQERNPELPTEWTKIISKTRALSGGFIPLEDYVGYGYSVGNSFIGDHNNITSPIVSLTKLRESFTTAITAQNIGETDISMVAYTDYDRYEEKINIKRVVKNGFTLNLGMFKLGRKNTQTEIFKSTNISETQRVHGELGIELRHGKYTLNTTSVVMKKIASECLDDIFLMSLYLTPISEILKDFGPLVVVGYFTGGRASALYDAQTDYKYDFESVEKDITEKIESSYTWAKDSTTKGDLEFGFNKGNAISQTNKIKNLYCYIHTTGGLAAIETTAKNIEEMNISLAPWISSLTEKETHVIIGFQDSGLMGLSEFVMEENFKRRIQDTHLGFTSNIELVEPFIEIVRVFVRNDYRGDKLYEVAAVLNTRQGDQIILSDGKAMSASDDELRANSIDGNVFKAKSLAIADEKRKYYQCEIRSNPRKTLNPIIRIPFNMSLSGFDESNMYKFKNDETNMWYIYDSVKRYAFAYYDLDGMIPDIYGISNWIETIPEKKLSMTVLSQFYKVIGL